LFALVVKLAPLKVEETFLFDASSPSPV
jgi:hypothetical protein